jgi:Chalcone isomerase-like
MRPRLTALMLSLSLAIPATLFAATLAGVTVGDSATVNGQTLVLNGVGLRKKLFIKIYVGGLYLAAKQSNAATVMSADGPRRMEMHFLYGVSKNQMADAWEEGLTNNTPNASAEVKNNFKTLQSWMDAIPSGNAMNLTYVPGTGTTVEINGKAVGTLTGKATSDAILATWIGSNPAPGEDFKKAVLGAK